MSSEIDDFTRKLLERTRARQEAMQQKMMEHSAQSRKRRPLEAQDNVEGVAQSVAQTASAQDPPKTESPNKRSRMECLEDIENEKQEEKAAVAPPSVGERMRKIMSQRKQWEAADHGEEVDFSVCVSPVQHDPSSPLATSTLQRPVDVERKARMAALAHKVNSWEDDLTKTHISPTKTDVVKPKPPIGRKTPMTQTYAAEISAKEPSPVVAPTTMEPVRPVAKNISKRVSLSIETLSQFAGPKKPVVKAADNNTPVKLTSTIQARLGDNKITVSSLGSEDKVATHQVTPTSKSLQQRLIELQRNGCQAEQQQTLSDRSWNERQQEINQLREEDKNETSVNVDECMPSESDFETSAIEEQLENEQMTKDISSGFPAVQPGENISVESRDCDEDEDLEESIGSYGDSMMDDSTGQPGFGEITTLECGVHSGQDLESCGGQDLLDSSAQDLYDCTARDSEVSSAKDSDDCIAQDNEDVDYEDLGNLSGELSVLKEDVCEELDASHGDQSDAGMVGSHPGGLDEDEYTQEDDEKDTQDDQDVDDDDTPDAADGEDTMIDELFEFEEDLTPPRAASPITIPSLTRQRSRMEIKSELTVRKQTCNEAEDIYFSQQSVSRQPSRRLRPLARSNSTESVRSLGGDEEQKREIPVFTIDAYRTEKRKSLRKTDQRVVRKESMKNKKSSPPPTSVQEEVSRMLDEVQQQQRVIQQASAALNCCYDAQHGKGSITELEAEKLLLVSSEKRLALLAGIQELKGRGKQVSTNGMSACNGSIKVDQIRLPLRTEYIFSMANSKKDGGDVRGHYYFIIVRCGARKIFATHLASTHDSLSCDSLVFKDNFQLNNLESDFEIVIEVYSKNQKNRADGVPHNEKSKSKFSEMIQKGSIGKAEGIIRKFGTLRRKSKEETIDSLTPRKTKARAHNSLPHTASPGGPNAIRISSFSLIGSTSIKLADVEQDKFQLQKVPFLSPISGTLACRITADFQSDIQQRGFLTMFDDVGGLGAWHRRWCALDRGILFSWTYPDDEKHKTPLSRIALKECISEHISTVERIRCARPNTFELRTMRPRRHGDRDNLISQDTGSVITTKHWLAADTKDERVVWIDSLNQALSDVRAWDSSALKPFTRQAK